MVDDLRDKDRKNAKASQWEEFRTFPVLERKGGMTTRSCRHWLYVHKIMKSLISILLTARSLLADGGK